MTKIEYTNLIKELAPEWKHPVGFNSRKDAIDFYYNVHRINSYLQDIKTRKLIKIKNSFLVKEYTVKELKEHKSVYQILNKEYEIQNKLEEIEKDF